MAATSDPLKRRDYNWPTKRQSGLYCWKWNGMAQRFSVTTPEAVQEVEAVMPPKAVSSIAPRFQVSPHDFQRFARG
jgi:hypothetical protein